MPEPSHPRPGEPGASASSPDWAADVAGRIESAVGAVRSRTSDRLVDIARTLVFGLLASVMALVAVVIAIITAIRVLDIALPGEVWVPYFTLGAIFLAAGAFCWSKRSSSPRS